MAEFRKLDLAELAASAAKGELVDVATVRKAGRLLTALGLSGAAEASEAVAEGLDALQKDGGKLAAVWSALSQVDIGDDVSPVSEAAEEFQKGCIDVTGEPQPDESSAKQDNSAGAAGRW